MASINTSVPADLSGSTLLSSRDALDIYRMIPSTAFPTTELDNVKANETGGVWTYTHFYNSVLQFTIQITNVTGSNYEWVITEPSFLLLEDGFQILAENSDELILEG